MTLESALFALVLLLYFASSVSYHAHLFAGSERARRAVLWLVPVGVLVHTAAIGIWCTTHRGSSILRDPAMPVSLVAFFIALIQVGLNFIRGWAALGSLSMPFAFISQFYASLLTPGSAVQAPPGSRLLSPHVMALLLGFAAFTLAFCLAVFYLVQSRLLKNKQVRVFGGRLPALDSIATGAHWLAAIGFSMLTLGIITGALAAPEIWGERWYLDSRTLTSLVAWAIYAAYLAVSMFMGWRGRRTTYFLIAGFLIILIAFIASVRRPHSPVPTSAAGFVVGLASLTLESGPEQDLHRKLGLPGRGAKQP